MWTEPAPRPEWRAGLSPLIIRPDRWTIVMGAAGCLLALGWLVLAGSSLDLAGMIPAFGTLAVFGYALARAWRCSAQADETGLMLRGISSSRRLEWREIRGFTLEDSGWLDPTTKSLVAHLSSGESVAITASFGQTKRQLVVASAALDEFVGYYGAPRRPD